MESKVNARKRGNTWFLDWREDGRRQRRSLGPVSEAEAKTEAKRLELALMDGRPAAGLVPTLQEYYLANYGPWSRRYHPASWDRKEGIFEHHLLPAFGYTPLDDLGLDLVEQWVEQRLNEGAAAATVQRELRALKACLNHAVKRGTIYRPPCAAARVPLPPTDPSPHWYDTDALAALYGAENDPLWAATWKLVANTGMRRGEAQALTWDDVDDDYIRIRSIDEARRTKSGKSRRVPLSPGARDALAVLLEKPGPYVLPRIAPPSLSRRFAKVTARAGVEGSFHSLRHTFVTHLLNAGNPLHVVKDLAGHADVHTTMRYAHTSPQYAADAVSGLSL